MQITWLLCGHGLESNQGKFILDSKMDWQFSQALDFFQLCLQCFDAVGQVIGKSPGLYTILLPRIPSVTTIDGVYPGQKQTN